MSKNKSNELTVKHKKYSQFFSDFENLSGDDPVVLPKEITKQEYIFNPDLVRLCPSVLKILFRYTRRNFTHCCSWQELENILKTNKTNRRFVCTKKVNRKTFFAFMHKKNAIHTSKDPDLKYNKTGVVMLMNGRLVWNWVKGQEYFTCGESFIFHVDHVPLGVRRQNRKNVLELCQKYGIEPYSTPDDKIPKGFLKEYGELNHQMFEGYSNPIRWYIRHANAPEEEKIQFFNDCYFRKVYIGEKVPKHVVDLLKLLKVSHYVCVNYDSYRYKAFARYIWNYPLQRKGRRKERKWAFTEKNFAYVCWRGRQRSVRMKEDKVRDIRLARLKKLKENRELKRRGLSHYDTKESLKIPDLWKMFLPPEISQAYFRIGTQRKDITTVEG